MKNVVARGVCGLRLWGLSWCIIVVSLYEVMLHYDTTAHINIPLYQTMLVMTDDSTHSTMEHVTAGCRTGYWDLCEEGL